MFGRKYFAFLVLILGLATCGGAWAGLSDGLMAYWSFDDCTAKDNSGNGNNGEIYGTQCVQGQIGKALDFNGTSDYVKIQDSKTLSGFSGLTLSAWIYKTKNLTGIYDGGIITKWYQNSPDSTSKINQDTYALYTSEFVQGYTSHYVDLTHNVQDTDVAPLNQWFHVVFTHSNTNGGKLYVNGILKSTISTGGNIIPSSNPVILGADNNNGTIWRFFQGKLDELRIYNRTLSEAEIQQLYSGVVTETAANQPPVASFTATPASGSAPLAVSLDATASSDPDGSIASYAWSTSDGQSASGKSAFLTFAKTGTYTVTLTVTDDKGATNSTAKTITVTAATTAPTVTYVSPTILVRDKENTITLTGSGLSKSIDLAIDGCATLTSISVSDTSRVYSCIPTGIIGPKAILISDGSGNTLKNDFSIYLNDTTDELSSAAIPTPSSDTAQIEDILNYAELNYPTLFSPKGAKTLSLDEFAYRYYADTDSYLAAYGGEAYYVNSQEIIRLGSLYDYWFLQNGYYSTINSFSAASCIGSSTSVYGSCIGTFLGVDAKSRGDLNYASENNTYQCVNYIKRFLHATYDWVPTSIGDAATYADSYKINQSFLEIVTSPKPGDVLVQTKAITCPNGELKKPCNKYGHVAIVTNTDHANPLPLTPLPYLPSVLLSSYRPYVEVIQQNVGRGDAKGTYPLETVSAFVRPFEFSYRIDAKTIDITVPDGQKMKAGTYFTKTILLYATGIKHLPDPEKISLELVKGDNLAVGSKIVDPKILPGTYKQLNGENIGVRPHSVTLNMQAPDKAKDYSGTYRLVRLIDGKPVGPNFTVKIRVIP